MCGYWCVYVLSQNIHNHMKKKFDISEEINFDKAESDVVYGSTLPQMESVPRL